MKLNFFQSFPSPVNAIKEAKATVRAAAVQAGVNPDDCDLSLLNSPATFVGMVAALKIAAHQCKAEEKQAASKPWGEQYLARWKAERLDRLHHLLSLMMKENDLSKLR